VQLFEKPKGSDIRLFGTPRRVALGMGQESMEAPASFWPSSRSRTRPKGVRDRFDKLPLQRRKCSSRRPVGTSTDFARGLVKLPDWYPQSSIALPGSGD
jgi:3-polyprenyl-4-hydroxybenzoate decarboxylase